MQLLKGDLMGMIRIVIQVPRTLKTKLDTARKGGTTASGFIRHLLEQHFTSLDQGQKGR